MMLHMTAAFAHGPQGQGLLAAAGMFLVLTVLHGFGAGQG